MACGHYEGSGFEPIFEKRIVLETGEFLLSKAVNRSVTGSMNEMIWRAKYHLIRDEISPFDVSSLLTRLLCHMSNTGTREMLRLMAEEPKVRQWEAMSFLSRSSTKTEGL